MASSESRRRSSRSAVRDTAPPESGDEDVSNTGGERLQKILAAAGFGSRRECEELITEGRVEVDGEFVTELGIKVDLSRQAIEVNGEKLKIGKRFYYAVNKPKGVVSTNRDPDGRMRVIDLIDSDERLYCVGRLDRASEGLILVTNDGDLANKLTHPRYGIEKTYHVMVPGAPTREDLVQLKKGVPLAEGIARVVEAKIRRKLSRTTELELVLREGKNREIRRILAKLGHKCLTLRRVAIGPLRLGTLETGTYRPLTSTERKKLDEAVAAAGAERPSRPRRGPSGRVPSRRAPGSRTTETSSPEDRPRTSEARAGGARSPMKGNSRTRLETLKRRSRPLGDEDALPRPSPRSGRARSESGRPGRSGPQVPPEDFRDAPLPRAKARVIAFEDGEAAPPKPAPARPKRVRAADAVDDQGRPLIVKRRSKPAAESADSPAPTGSGGRPTIRRPRAASVRTGAAKKAAPAKRARPAGRTPKRS